MNSKSHIFIIHLHGKHCAQSGRWLMAKNGNWGRRN